MPYKAKAENVATTNAYASILKVSLWDTQYFSIIIRNNDATKVADWKILVSNGDGTANDVWATEKAEAQLAGNTTTKYPASTAVTPVSAWIDIQAKSNSAGNAALLYVYVYSTK